MADLSHIQRQIQNDQVKAQDFRKQAMNEQRLAQQYQGRGTGGEATFHEQEAARMNEKANEMEEEAQKLQGEKDQQEQRLNELQKNHLPLVIFCAGTAKSELPLLKERFVPGKTLIYICQNNSCQLPVETVEEAIEIIRKK